MCIRTKGKGVPNAIFFGLGYWADDDTINWTKEVQQKVLRVGEELCLFWHFDFEVSLGEDIKYVVAYIDLNKLVMDKS